jgi:hypothetical protein
MVYTHAKLGYQSMLVTSCYRAGPMLDVTPFVHVLLCVHMCSAKHLLGPARLALVQQFLRASARA